MKMTVLFISEVVPFPVNSGERIRTYGLLKIMSELNLNVIAVTGKSKNGTNELKEIRGVEYYPYDFYNEHHVKKAGIFQNISKDEAFIKHISNILTKTKVDFVFIDFSYRGQYIQFFKDKGLPVIYGTHNAQATIIRQKPADNLRGEISKRLHFLINKFHELNYFRKADALIVVSEGDLNYHASFIKKDKIYVIPNFLIESEYSDIQMEKEDNIIIMTANFKAFQNIYGLEWFIREVWDDELSGIFKLHLVGRDSKEVHEKLSKIYPMKNIIAIGEVGDIKPHLARARASIVPLLHGSGSRLKCLESMALKTILISTSKGAEGIEHDNSIIIADSPAEFKESLMNLSTNYADLCEKAFKIFSEKYSLEPNKKIFEHIIKEIISYNEISIW